MKISCSQSVVLGTINLYLDILGIPLRDVYDNR